MKKDVENKMRRPRRTHAVPTEAEMAPDEPVRAEAAQTAYRVCWPLAYTAPDGTFRRAVPGDVVTDLPASSISWLLRQHLVEPVDVRCHERP